MPHKTLHFVSPSFTYEKLESRRFSDLVDVFEDRMRGWLLNPAKHLLSLPHGAVAAVSLSMTYFEGIEIYHSGEDSSNRSKGFFRRGLQRVFGVAPNGACH